MMPHEFDAAITDYREAHRRCQVLSGDALSAAQDQEVEALDALARTPRECLGDISDKLTVLRGLTHEGRRFDGRDFRLLDSIRRDVKAMVLRCKDRERPYAVQLLLIQILNVPLKKSHL
jgi:hypothetical protein